MKKIMYTLALLTLFTFHAEANHYSEISGIYFNDFDLNEIRVRSSNRWIKVQGLSWKRPNKWIKFRRVDRNRFQDRNGNMLRVQTDRFGFPKLVIDRRGGREVYKISGRQVRNGRQSCTIEDDYYYDYRHGALQGDVRRRSDRGDRRGDRNRSYNFNNNRDRASSLEGMNLEGTYVDDTGRKIAILRTRDGFKAKFSGDRTWKNYIRNGNVFR